MNHKRIVKDMAGRKVEVPQKPKRIISLVPSQTELLYYLGLNEEVVGQTIFCIHPAEIFKEKTKIGGTKKLNFEKIKSLEPDLIIANKEENNKADIELLEAEYTVWVSNVVDLPSAIEMILQIGFLVDKPKSAMKLCNEISNNFKNINTLKVPLKTYYMIWQKPYMAAGKDTFINSLLNLYCFKNLAVNKSSRYPEISVEELKDAQCILLSSEPFPFKEKHIAYLKEINPKAVIKIVDGEMFSWYGSRLLYATKYLNNLVDEINCVKIE